MAELSRLLAFMFKEDKEDILAKYNKMLDEAEDEQALLEEFGSPTKLAVTISRTYKREERKLSVEADSKEDTQSAPLEFGKKAAEETAGKEPEPDVPSYADIIEEIRREKAAEQGARIKGDSVPPTLLCRQQNINLQYETPFLSSQDRFFKTQLSPQPTLTLFICTRISLLS